MIGSVHQWGLPMPLFHHLMNFDFIGEHIHLQAGIPVYCDQMPSKIVDFRLIVPCVLAVSVPDVRDAADCMTTLA